MKINELQIRNIRGIKDASFTPKGENLVIFGPNGTGKSAVVDAIDFLVSGKISRLTGEGTRCLKLGEHGCHVDSQKNLENATISAKVELGGEKLTICRSISDPRKIKVDPIGKQALVESYFEKSRIGQYILSRREILSYITAEAGKRGEQIQALLDLSVIEDLRKTLGTVNNRSEQELGNAERELKKSENEICNLFSINSFSKEELLAKINLLKKDLGAIKIDELTIEKIKGAGGAEYHNEQDHFTITQIRKFILGAKNALLEKEGVFEKIDKIKSIIENIRKDAELKNYLNQIRLLEAGIQLTGDSSQCPLCGQSWTEGKFIEHLERRKKRIESNKEKHDQLKALFKISLEKIDLLRDNLTKLSKAKKQLRITPDSEAVVNETIVGLSLWMSTLQDPEKLIENNKFPEVSLEETLAKGAVEKNLLSPLENKVREIGDRVSKKENTRNTLSKIEILWSQYEEKANIKKRKKLLNGRAKLALELFKQSRDKVLRELYEKIKQDFEIFYKTLHSEDEDNFSAMFSHTGAALNFEVDFYGRAMVPPHALHSEGHQDSMGICLFLALNKYLSRENIKVVILDDVVMSIDNDHRRKVCQLLKKFFPDTQFVITTHDTIWAKQLKSEGIVSKSNSIQFLNWHVESGPTFKNDEDLWDRINHLLGENNIAGASFELRKNAECFFSEVCSLLAAKVPYNERFRWDLGELTAAAIGTYKDYLKRAKENASKYNNKSLLDELSEIEKYAGKVIARSQVEQWAINENVHYNKWANFSKADFTPVVTAFKDLFALFNCNECKAPLEKGGKTLSCNCGKTNWIIGE